MAAFSESGAASLGTIAGLPATGFASYSMPAVSGSDFLVDTAFLATLTTGADGVTPANARGIFFSFEGAPLEPRGLLGATRSFNFAGQLVYRATFTDRTQAIVRLQIP